MKMSRRLLIVVFCGTLLSSCFSSCFNPPEYPDIPEIVFKSVDFLKGKQSTDGSGPTPDSIILKLSFKDGDGDVGVGSGETYPPFNDRWYLTKGRLGEDSQAPGGYDCSQYGNRCWYLVDPVTDPEDFKKYVDYADRSKTPGYDTLRDFVKPYNCINWSVVYHDDDNDESTLPVPLDTLYFQLNPHYSNIFVEFQSKTDDAINPFEAFDEKEFFTYPLCGVRTFDGRIPVLSEDLSRSTPLEGEIRYAIPSVSYQTIFGSKTLRLKVYIEDRALHQSNVVYTREFNLHENN